MRIRILLLLIALTIAFVLGRWSTSHIAKATVSAQAQANSHLQAKQTNAVPFTPSSFASSSDTAEETTDGTHATNSSETGKHTSTGMSIENLMFAQPYMFSDELSRILPSTPGTPHLYAIGFAGDGDEPAFRNEVDYLKELLSKRFGAGGRMLELINSPRTYQTIPLATRTNLRNAFGGLTEKMNRENDILFLFLTSHGSEDHDLFVKLGALPLDQITPETLRYDLDYAKIRWRVIVISACYSGGFIPALREPHTLIITAARSDRSSFGCGSDSRITYFGAAFLVDALNTTTNFREAYERASADIAGWERRDREMPSEPQLWEGDQIEAKLAAWRATLPSAPPVPFAPNVIAGSSPRPTTR